MEHSAEATVSAFISFTGELFIALTIHAYRWAKAKLYGSLLLTSMSYENNSLFQAARNAA